MDYSHLKILIKKKGQTIKNIAELIEMSEQGLHSAMRNNTLKIKDLERICFALKESPCIFFEDHTNSYTLPEAISGVADDVVIYKKRTKKEAETERKQIIVTEINRLAYENEMLKKQIIDKEEIINLLKNKQI